MEFERVYYRIRFPAKAGGYGEFYHSNNGTTQWGELSKVKALLSRGQPRGYKGRTLVPFADFEVVEVTERIAQSSKVVVLPIPPEEA